MPVGGAPSLQDRLTERNRRIFDLCEEEGTAVDRVLVRTETEPFLDPTFFYVTGLVNGLFENASAVLSPDGGVALFVPRLEEDLAAQGPVPADAVTAYDRSTEHDRLVADALEGAERVGYHGRGLSVRAFDHLDEVLEDVALVDVGAALGRARLVKDADEVARIEEAGEVASTIMAELSDLLRPGAREREVAAEIEYRIKELGASGPAFDTIVAFGPHSAEPHYAAGDGELASGDLALVDFGAVVDRYRSDVTRTFVCGPPTDKQRRMIEVVLQAQQAAIDAVAPGVPMEEVHAAAADVIDGSAFKGRFIHSTGHGLGLATHDGGRLAEGEEDALEEGMVFTVEPGVYLPGEGGVRIEDDVVVTADGCRALTGGTKGLDDLLLDV